MVIAVAYDDGQIGEHFGHATTFALYTYQETEDEIFLDTCEKKLIDASSLHGHKQMADLMKENGVDAVMSQNMGAEAKQLLLSYGIVPVIGYMGDADIAADMLITGQLPIVEGGSCGGGCGGGCGGCGGECHHDEDGECDCGCGGCH